jgi:flagellar motor switch protein FliN/FliY
MSEETEKPEEDWDEVIEDAGGASEEEDPWAAALEEQADAEAEAEAVPVEQLNDSAKPSANADMNLDMVLELPVTISMEIGRTKISIRNLLQLTQGSVIELDRLAGEAMDVLVNDTLIAHGEVVVVNDKFGIRLTDVISADERIKKLK